MSDLSWKAVLDLYACTECGRCEEQCPASMTGKPLSPKQVVHDAKSDLLQQSDAILARSFDAVTPFVREDSPITADVLWSCTSCRACEDICPVNIQHMDILLEARKHQVLMEASFPPEMQDTFANLENQSNPWGFGSDTRGDWAGDLGVPRMCNRPEAELLFYVGCAGSFDDRGKKISRAMARVLKKAGVDFAILGEEERCNGDLARRASNEYLAQMMIRENAAVLNQYRPRGSWRDARTATTRSSTNIPSSAPALRCCTPPSSSCRSSNRGGSRWRPRPRRRWPSTIPATSAGGTDSLKRRASSCASSAAVPAGWNCGWSASKGLLLRRGRRPDVHGGAHRQAHQCRAGR